MVSRICGGFAVLVGLIVVVAWYAHWPVLIQILPDLPPMKYNTALCFILSGLGLAFLTTRRSHLSFWLGIAVGLIGLLTLLQYGLDADLGIDELFFKAYIITATQYPGRMSPLAASCFICYGVALAGAGWKVPHRPFLTAIGLLCCIVGTISFVALCGPTFGIDSANGWGLYTRMAVHTAIAFLFLSVGLLVWANEKASQIRFNFLRWLPVTGSATLMLMISFVSAISFSQMKKSNDWRRHSYDVLATSQNFLGDIFDTQRGMRDYVLSGKLSALDSYQDGMAEAPQQLKLLEILTRDNPGQQARLKVLDADFDEIRSYAQRLVDVNKTEGPPAALKMESSGEGFMAVNHLLFDLQQFNDEEHRLLELRSAQAEADFQNTKSLLIFGSILAAVLLVVSNLMASHEVHLRQRTEEKLQAVAGLQKAILNSANYAIISTTPQGLVTTFNATAERWFGYSAKEVIGRLTPAAWHDEKEIVARAEVLSKELGRPIQPGFEAFIAKAVGGKSDENEWTFIRRDGTRFPVWLSASALTDGAGAVTGYLGVITDISERKEIERELEKNRARLDGILNNSLDGVIAYEAIRDEKKVIRDFRFIVVNPAAEKLSGRTARELVGRRMLDVFPRLDREPIFGKFVEIVETGVAQDFEYYSERGSSTRWYRIAGARLGDGLAVSYAEITERKKEIEALATNEALLQQFIAHSPAAIAMLDTEMRYLQISGRWLSDYHLTDADIIGKSHYEVFPDQPERWKEIHRRVLAGAIERCDEDPFPRADGRTEWLQWEVRPWYKAERVIGGVIFFTQVITARKEAEEAMRQKEEELRLSEERFSSAFELAAIGMALVSLDGRWLKVNESLCRLIGYSAEELSRTTFVEITHPDDLENDLENVRKLLAGEIRSYTMEKRYLHKAGHIVWVLLGVSLVRDKQNQPLHFISQIEDITATKAAMARQQELTVKAQAAERAKSEFLAIMSHEIRTPMNGVIGMTSILADTELTEMQRDCVTTIQNSGESLLTVINDILDFSKIESGKMNLESRAFNLEDCVESALDLFAVQIRAKRLEGAYLVASNIPAELIGDATRLRQILVNLIGNAIKFTARGEIIINVKSKKRDEQGCHLLFSVTDTGIGIPPEGVEKLFQAFQQVDTSTTRKYGGTGLGLVISKRLAEFMGGTMWVESEVGAGSTFYFTVVMKEAPAAAANGSKRAKPPLASRSILIVDDNATNQHILQTQLKIWGMTSQSVTTGREALNILEKQKFDAVLVDLQMPEMDGITLAREIHRRNPVPLVLLSSSGEVIVGEEAGYFRYQIPKPIKHSHLFDALLRISGVEHEETPKVISKQFDIGLGVLHPLRILLAEDNTVNQKVGLKMLSQFGYTADLAANGRLALEAVDKARQPYDLILMDIQMPEMDGIEAAHILHGKLKEKCPPIYALTAEALEGDRDRFLGLGFDGYLSKPIQTPALREVLKSIKPSA